MAKKSPLQEILSDVAKASTKSSSKSAKSSKTTSKTTKTTATKTDTKVDARAASIAAATAVAVVASKKNKSAFLIVAVFFILGALAGGILCSILASNDTFELVGDKTVTLLVGESYSEKGVKVVSLGRDLSSTVKVEGQVNVNAVGTYTLVYTVSDVKYGDYQLYRVVNVVGGEQDANQDIEQGNY